MQCPACHQPLSIQGNAYRPFCSERCRLVDLNAWLTEQYRVPVDDGMVEQDADNDGREIS